MSAWDFDYNVQATVLADETVGMRMTNQDNIAKLDAMTIEQQRAHAVMVTLTDCPYDTSAAHDWLLYADTDYTRCFNCGAYYYR